MHWGTLACHWGFVPVVPRSHTLLTGGMAGLLLTGVQKLETQLRRKNREREMEGGRGGRGGGGVERGRERGKDEGKGERKG